MQSAALFAAAVPQSAQLMPASATVPSAVQPADLTSSVRTPSTSTQLYTAKRGDSLPAIARHYLGQTSYLTSSELADAIRAANKLGSSNIVKAGEQITIPGILPAPIVARTVPVPKDFEVRAIYLTGIMAASDHGLRIIRQWRQVGGNAIVFDIKDSDGSVNIPYEHALLGKHNIYIHDLPKFIHFLHSENMHAIARIAIFRDQRLVTEHPELAVHSKKSGQPWRENGKLVWTDSSNPKVQDYNIALAKYVAQSGADEIQFDYVRFPAEGDQKDAGFVFQKDHPSWQRSDVITDFLRRAYAELHPTGVLLSLDVFGVMAWQRQVDLSHTGQDIVKMAQYCDVLSPMIYPSHFFGMDNIARPGDAPEHFIAESMERFEAITHTESTEIQPEKTAAKSGAKNSSEKSSAEKTADEKTAADKSIGQQPAGQKSIDGKTLGGVVIRPWLQAFHWRTKSYSPEYIKIQVATAMEKGGIGFLFWNAANDYSKPYTAMPEMKAENLKAGSNAQPKYFRGDELPATNIRASLSTGN
jgi:LysM repeat protein